MNPRLTLVSLVATLALTAGVRGQTAPAEPPLPSGQPGTMLADQPAAAKVVKSVEVRFKGDATVDKARITSNMRLKVGETWTREKEEDDLRALYNSGNLLNVTIDTTDVPGGVNVVVTAQARPAMGDLVFQGNTVFKTERLRDEAEFKAGTVVDDTKLNEVRAKILELDTKRGYAETTVTYSIEPGSQPGFSRIVFRIDEGGRGILNQVKFEGNTVFTSRRLKSIVESDDRNWIKVWDLKRKITQEKIEADIRRVQDAYGNAGYFDARVDNVDQVRIDDKKTDLVFRISEGPQYTTGAVALTGNKVFESSTLIPVFQLEAGTIFSLADMKTDIDTIEDYYGSRGYADVSVTPRISKNGNTISITYGIEEGQQFKLGRVNISGNSETRTEVILREMALEPGDDYNTIKVKKSMTRLSLGFTMNRQKNPLRQKSPSVPPTIPGGHDWCVMPRIWKKMPTPRPISIRGSMAHPLWAEMGRSLIFDVAEPVMPEGYLPRGRESVQPALPPPASARAAASSSASFAAENPRSWNHRTRPSPSSSRMRPLRPPRLPVRSTILCAGAPYTHTTAGQSSSGIPLRMPESIHPEIMLGTRPGIVGISTAFTGGFACMMPKVHRSRSNCVSCR
jgi:hypothetical protein